MSLDSASSLNSLNALGVFPRRSLAVRSASTAADDSHFQTVAVYLYSFNPESFDDRVKIDFHKRATTEELIEKVLQQRQGESFLPELFVFFCKKSERRWVKFEPNTQK